MQTARAQIGDNSSRFFPEEKLPPKAQRIVSIDRARQVEIAARQVSALFRTPKNRILEKRKGGEEGRALRRFLILYARGIGSPVWECAMLFGLNRKQIGQEEASYLDMLARNPELEADADNLISMCDYAARVEVGRFIRVSLSEIQADAAHRKALKTVQDARERLEAPPSARPVKPSPRLRQSEADRIVAEGQAKRKREALAQAERIFRATIAAGDLPGATESARKDAAKARKALAELGLKV